MADNESNQNAGEDSALKRAKAEEALHVIESLTASVEYVHCTISQCRTNETESDGRQLTEVAQYLAEDLMSLMDCMQTKYQDQLNSLGSAA